MNFFAQRELFGRLRRWANEFNRLNEIGLSNFVTRFFAFGEAAIQQ